MTAVFTDHAVANLQLMATTTAEKAELSDLMMRLRDLRGSDDIRAHGGRDLAWAIFRCIYSHLAPYRSSSQPHSESRTQSS